MVDAIILIKVSHFNIKGEADILSLLDYPAI